MKLRDLFFLMCLVPVTALAQPQFSGTSPTALVGTTYQLSKFTPSDLNVGNGGANASWDFTQLTADSVSNAEIMLPGSTPYADSFALSNICFRVGGDYYFYLINNNEFSNTGLVVDGVTYMGDGEDPERLMTYPLSFQSTLNDDFTSRYNSLGLNYERSGSSVVDYDGYGDLDLPTGSYTDVLRLKIEETFKDSSNIFGFPVETNFQTTAYSWYIPGVYFPILNITRMIRTSDLGTDTLWWGTYSTNQVVSVANESPLATSMKIFPNPATDWVQLNWEPAAVGSELQVTLLSGAGQMLRQETVFGGSGSARIDVRDLAAGVYLLDVQDGTNRRTTPVIVR